MPQRMKAEERREQLLALMTHLQQQAQTQGDFTAELVAKAAGISTVLLYRYAGAEFQALRAQLPGIHRVRDEVMSDLRREHGMLQQQLQEEENLYLRGEVKRLRKQLEDTTRVVVHVPATRSPIPHLTLVEQEHDE
jgi:AcrR family transcriptional regulator